MLFIILAVAQEFSDDEVLDETTSDFSVVCSAKASLNS